MMNSRTECERVHAGFPLQAPCVPNRTSSPAWPRTVLRFESARSPHDDHVSQSWTVGPRRHELRRILASLDPLPDHQPSARGSECPQRDPPGRALEQGREGQDRVDYLGLGQRLRMADLAYALPDGNAARNGEDQDRDNETPELEFAPVPEGDSGSGRRRDRLIPWSKRTAMSASTKVCTASDTMAKEPKTMAAP